MARLHNKFGLIGHPIDHSLSPSLFKAGYDGRYPYELIETSDFEEAYERFMEGYDGINVTAPFKEVAYSKADIISQECRLVGATNLLVKTPEGVKAYNSDFLGVQSWLTEVLDAPSNTTSSPDGPESKRTPPTLWVPPPAARGVARFSLSGPSGEEERNTADNPICLIAGCGGAGKAAAAAAVSLGMECILMNRNTERAEKLANHLGDHGYKAKVARINRFREFFRKADIIIYNIPTAIEEISQLTDDDLITDKKKHILEANYKDPSFSEGLIRKMKTYSPLIQYTGGNTWLLYQAMTGYEIFTGEKPDFRKMSAVL